MEGRVEDPPPRHYEVLTADFRRVLKRAEAEKSQNGVFLKNDVNDDLTLKIIRGIEKE